VVVVETVSGDDPLLVALSEARRDRDVAEERIRRLLAFGREFAGPRPYTLAVLAAAAGMSISGVRSGYQQGDVDAVREALEATVPDGEVANRLGVTWSNRITDFLVRAVQTVPVTGGHHEFVHKGFSEVSTVGGSR